MNHTLVDARQWIKAQGCEDFAAKGLELSYILEAYARAVLAEAERALRERATNETVDDEYEAGYEAGIELAADLLAGMRR